MPLNPTREMLGQAGLHAYHHESTFKSESESALAEFQAFRDALERQVRRGDLTVKVARQKAETAAGQLRASLQKRAEDYSPVPRVFLDRLIEAGNTRKKARDSMSMEGLQRETNRLLRQSLIEQQLQSRAVEFEGRTFIRSMTGGVPAPTVDTLLAYHTEASHAGDEAAVEWTRRQLEGFRSRTVDPDTLRKIDLACDSPEKVNPRLVNTYVEALDGSDPDALETFVSHALEDRDSNACMAAFMLARQAPEGTRPRWVRMVLNGLGSFPDAALNTLRALEAEARAADSESARAQADYAIAVAESIAHLDSVEAPSEAELARQARILSRPVGAPGEPIGLALDRRGLTPEEFAALGEADPEIA
jgi:hypothetical protein